MSDNILEYQTDHWEGYDKECEKLRSYHEAVEKEKKEAEEAGQLKEWLRMKCRTDLFYLLVYILGRTDIDHVTDDKGKIIHRPWLFERCMEVQKNPDGYLDIWARDHYKTTIITYGKTIQDILINPEITICFYAYNQTLAGKMLTQVRKSLESNSTLIQLFPDILFDNTRIKYWKDEDGIRHKMNWSDESFTVKRKGNPKEATCESSGLVVGQKTGGHYNLLIYDDIEVPESVSTPLQILKTTSQFEMSLNTASSQKFVVRMLGTRYSLDDTYIDILKKKVIKLRKYPCYRGNEPVLYSQEILDYKRLQMTHGVWEAQMLCDPQANSIWRFSMNWIPNRIDTSFKDEYNAYIICDPAASKGKQYDFTTMWVVCLNSDKQYLISEYIHDQLDLVEKGDALFGLVKKYTGSRGKPTVFYEKTGLQTDISYYLDRQKREDFYFTIKSASGKPRLRIDQMMTGCPMKEQRIQALVPLFKQHKIYFPEKCMYTTVLGNTEDTIEEFFRDEYIRFPFVSHDDGLDALSRIADLDSGILMVFPDKKVKANIYNIQDPKPDAYTFVESCDGYIPY